MATRTTCTLTFSPFALVLFLTPVRSMGNDLDYSQAEVREDIIHWGEWITQELGLSGFRLDAVKHFSWDFLQSWISYLDRSIPGPPLLMIGEYWRDDLISLGSMIEKLRGRLLLFDVMLATNMSKLSVATDGDMRGILTNTLAKHYPRQAVVFTPNCPPHLPHLSSMSADRCISSVRRLSSITTRNPALSATMR